MAAIIRLINPKYRSQLAQYAISLRPIIRMLSRTCVSFSATMRCVILNTGNK